MRVALVSGYKNDSLLKIRLFLSLFLKSKKKLDQFFMISPNNISQIKKIIDKKMNAFDLKF